MIIVNDNNSIKTGDKMNESIEVNGEDVPVIMCSMCDKFIGYGKLTVFDGDIFCPSCAGQD